MTSKRPREQLEDTKQHEGEKLNALIGAQVIRTLGQPNDLLTVQVRSLWKDRFRVNVLVGVDVTSVKVAHSYFLVVDDNGNILASAPEITRQYGPLEGALK